MEPSIPTSFYVLVGFLMVSNIGAIGALIVFIFRCGMFVSETRLGIKDAKSVAMKAHDRIDALKTVVKQGR